MTGSVAVLGVPLDENSSFLRGAAEAPQAVRRVLHQGSGNFCAENGLDLENDSRWRDAGDLKFSEGAKAIEDIEDGVAALVDGGERVLALGGDHSITYPIIRAHARRYPDLSILHLDAHPDLFDSLCGNRYSHGSPFARIMEEKLAGRLVQLGIRTLNAHQKEQAHAFGVEMVEMKDWSPVTEIALEGPVYLSIDLDCFDPAFAPGVSHHEPGGFTTRDVLGIIQRMQGPLIGADIVELNPRRDPSQITAALAVKLLKEVIARMLG